MSGNENKIKLVSFLDVVGRSGQEAMDYMNKEQFMIYRGQASKNTAPFVERKIGNFTEEKTLPVSMMVVDAKTKETTERQKGNIDRFLKDYIGCTVIIPHFVGNRMIGEVRSQINEDGSLNTPEYVLF